MYLLQQITIAALIAYLTSIIMHQCHVVALPIIIDDALNWLTFVPNGTGPFRFNDPVGTSSFRTRWPIYLMLSMK
jgi:hypothetical protein